MALRGFPAAIIGGLDSTGGAIIGGLIVGVAESLAQGYATDLSFLGRGFHGVLPYVVMVAGAAGPARRACSAPRSCTVSEPQHTT